jgi:hypothetical protein
MNEENYFITIVNGRNLRVPISDTRTIAVFGYIKKFIACKSNGLKDERGIINDPKWVIFNGRKLYIDAMSKSVVVFDGIVDRITVLTKEGEVYQVFEVDNYGVISIADKNKVIKEYIVDDKGRLRLIENSDLG